MLFRNPNKPELIVEQPTTTNGNGNSPKAVVVVMGWFASKLRHVRKYSVLYEQRGCATITGSLDSNALIAIDVAKIQEYVHLIAHEATKLLRQGDDIPLVVHAFSNGGGIPLMQLEVMMNDATSKTTVSQEDADNNKNNKDKDNGESELDIDWHLIKDRLNAHIFDSAPAYPDFETFWGALHAGIGNIVVAFALFSMGAMYYMIVEALDKMKGQMAFRDMYWKHWVDSPLTTPLQAFVYSTADKITKSHKIDELCKSREDKGVKVVRLRFDDSLHVQHMMKHKDEYCNLLDDVLMEAANKKVQ